MSKIKRNDPCPCGSGKKYKKCCEKENVVSISDVLDSEILRLEEEIITYAMLNYENQLEDMADDILGFLNVPDELEEMFEIHLFNWMIFTPPIEDGDQTIIESFIKERLKRTKRPKLQEILSVWPNCRPTVSKVISISQNILTVEDIFTKQTQQITVDEEDDYEVNSVLVAIFVPGTDGPVPFIVPFEVPQSIGQSSGGTKGQVLCPSLNKRLIEIQNTYLARIQRS